MNKKAQASLEYLLTYGWALVLIVTVIVVLVFIVISPGSGVTFSSSDPTKILIKASNVSGTSAEIKMQNITGGRIEITGVSLTGGYSTCTLNTTNVSEISSSDPVPITAGGEMYIECSNVADASGTITVSYNDHADLQRSVSITASGTAAGEGETADTGFKPPTSTGEVANGWLTPAEAYSSNDQYASTGGAIEASGSIAVELSWDGGSSYTNEKIEAQNEDSDTTITFGSPSDTWGRSWTGSEFSNANFRLKVSVVFGGAAAPSQDYYDFSFSIPAGATIDGIEVEAEGHYEHIATIYNNFVDNLQVKVYYTEAP